MVHIDESALQDGLYDCAGQKPLLRAGTQQIIIG